MTGWCLLSRFAVGWCEDNFVGEYFIKALTKFVVHLSDKKELVLVVFDDIQLSGSVLILAVSEEYQIPYVKVLMGSCRVCFRPGFATTFR